MSDKQPAEHLLFMQNADICTVKGRKFKNVLKKYF